jgi:hypothetical protein
MTTDERLKALINTLYDDQDDIVDLTPDELAALAAQHRVPLEALTERIAEEEWDARGGAWIDAAEDGFNDLDTVAAYFHDRYGLSLEHWCRYANTVLEDRTEPDRARP